MSTTNTQIFATGPMATTPVSTDVEMAEDMYLKDICSTSSWKSYTGRFCA